MIVENIMRLKIFLISVFVILLLGSCNSYKYNITWKVLGVTTDRNITFTFWDHSTSKKYVYNLIPNKTEFINVSNGANYSGTEMPIDMKILIYPDPDKLPDGGNLEIFVFDPRVEQINENEFKMKSQNDVEAYFVKYSKNGKRYYALSKNEVISIKNEISPDIIVSMEQLLELIYIEDITYFDEAGTNNYNGSEECWGGYIIKTKIDNSYLWLNASHPYPN